MAGSIFTFSLTLGDYITPQLVSSTQFIGNVVYANVGVANNLPLAAAFATVPVVIMIVYLLDRPAAGRVRVALMLHLSTAHATRSCGSAPAITLAFLYVPLLVIALYAFNDARIAVVAARRASRSTGSTRRSTTRACATRSGRR